MSRIRGKWTKPERKIHNILKGNRIRHKMHPDIFGNPDVHIKGTNILIFIDRCFWHGCKRHFKMPESNRKFWKDKIENNIRRDARNRRKLKRMGYKIVRIWEHQLSSASSPGAAEAVLAMNGRGSKNSSP